MSPHTSSWCWLYFLNLWGHCWIFEVTAESLRSLSSFVVIPKYTVPLRDLLGECEQCCINHYCSWTDSKPCLVYSYPVWFPCFQRQPGAVARSEASSLGMRAALSSIPNSGTFFRGDLVMKTFLRPFSSFRWFKKSSCQLLAKECALSTGKLPRRLAQEHYG